MFMFERIFDYEGQQEKKCNGLYFHVLKIEGISEPAFRVGRSSGIDVRVKGHGNFTSDNSPKFVKEFLNGHSVNEIERYRLMSPYIKTCSILLKKKAKEKIVFMANLKKKLEYKRKSTA